MPNILALDSSTDACSVAVSWRGRVEARFEVAARTHTRRLLPLVDEVLSAAGCRLRDLDAIAFGCGPGSFTGLRICLGVVQGLAYGAQLPVVPVSTLAAMAYRFYGTPGRDTDTPLLVALDARMDEIYWCRYCWRDDGVHALSEEAVSAPGQVSEALGAGPIQGIGSGWHYSALDALQPSLRELEHYPHAEDILTLAEARYLSGGAVAVEQARPTYLRNEISWKKRRRIRS